MTNKNTTTIITVITSKIVTTTTTNITTTIITAITFTYGSYYFYSALTSHLISVQQQLIVLPFNTFMRLESRPKSPLTSSHPLPSSHTITPPTHPLLSTMTRPFIPPTPLPSCNTATRAGLSILPILTLPSLPPLTPPPYQPRSFPPSLPDPAFPPTSHTASHQPQPLPFPTLPLSRRAKQELGNIFGARENWRVRTSLYLYTSCFMDGGA